jgi:thioredoxin 1
MPELRDVTDQSFDQDVLASSTPVLVDFWGDHCPACRQISPILQQLAGEYAGRLAIVKMHAAENPRTSAKMGDADDPRVQGREGGRTARRRAAEGGVHGADRAGDRGGVAARYAPEHTLRMLRVAVGSNIVAGFWSAQRPILHLDRDLRQEASGAGIHHGAAFAARPTSRPSQLSCRAGPSLDVRRLVGASGGAAADPELVRLAREDPLCAARSS